MMASDVYRIVCVQKDRIIVERSTQTALKEHSWRLVGQAFESRPADNYDASPDAVVRHAIQELRLKEIDREALLKEPPKADKAKK
jgi:hypothetical protein